ncbi:hypothetical protein, partial [Mucilaginibacter sp. AK015]|uniref:hypothetical protein n=1 Tax=Mucilaginibacter sp. AK015 TaxID=2723072 RepID=UPI001C845F05
MPHKAFVPQSRQNHGLQNLASTSFAPGPCASGKYCYALAPLKATIVLLAFARSCFADASSQLPIDTSSYVCIGVVYKENKNNFIAEEKGKEKRLRR